MDLRIVLPATTAVLALLFFLAVLDQWLERRHAYQLIWALGMLWFSVAAGCEAIAAASGWSELLYRTWYLAGAVWTAGWLGLGTAFLLAKTRFSYAFAFALFLAGLFTFLTQLRGGGYPNSGMAPVLYFIAAGVLAIAIAVAAYFGDPRWPRLAAIAVVGATLLSLVLMVTVTLPAPGYALDPATGQPVATILPGYLRLLTPFLNVTGAFSLAFGAIFSAYVFMPKKRVLAHSLDPTQRGDEFLFNLLIAPVAIGVNFVASIPDAVRALLSGRLNSRVPAMLLIAAGGFVPAITDILNRFGSTQFYGLGKFLAVLFLFLGFLVSIDVFHEFRIPFTHIVLRRRAEKPDGQDGAGTEGAAAG